MTNIEKIKEQIWRIADKLMGALHPGSTLKVMILFMIIRRLECLFDPYREKVQKIYEKYKDDLDEEDLGKKIREIIDNLDFYTFSPYTFASLLSGGYNTPANFEYYFSSYDKETRYSIKYYGSFDVINELAYHKLLVYVTDAFAKMDLSEEAISSSDYSSLIQYLISNRFVSRSMAIGYTDTDLAEVIATLLFADKDTSGKVSIYDPACGYLNLLRTVGSKVKHSDIALCGQDIYPEAICLDRLVSKGILNDKVYVEEGNTLIQDEMDMFQFDYVVSDLPIAMRWDETIEMFSHGRYQAGFPSRNDATLLFAQHIADKLNDKGRAVFTCMPRVFTDADSGSNNIRSWMLGNDLIDCIVLLPSGMIYGAGVRVCLCILDKNKPERRKGKVQIINAEDLWPRQKNGKPVVNEVSLHQLWGTYSSFEESPVSRIFNSNSFDVFSLDVLQPKRNSKGEVMMKNGEKVADKDRTINVNIPSTEPDYIGYVKNNVLSHADKDAWIDFTTLKKTCSIDLHKYFVREVETRSFEEIESDMLQMRQEIMSLMTIIAHQEASSALVSEPEPVDTKVCLLGAVARVLRATRSSKDIHYVSKGEYPILNVKYLRGEEEPLQFADTLDKHVLVDNGDILMIINGANSGEVLEGKKGCLSGTIVKIDPISGSVLPEYLKLLLQAKNQEIRSLARGASIKNIVMSDLQALQLQIPSISDQHRIVETLHNRIQSIDKLLPMLGGKAKQTMQEYRQALIVSAVCGK